MQFGLRRREGKDFTSYSVSPHIQRHHVGKRGNKLHYRYDYP